MSTWIDVAPQETITSGNFQLVTLEEINIMVFNLDGNFYAIEDVCTHDGGSLSDGEIKNCEIICPRHGARFDIKTGDVTAPPAYEPIHTFPVRVHQGIVQVRDDRFD